MSKRERILVLLLILAVGFSAYIWYKQPGNVTPVRRLILGQDSFKQYRIDYNYPHEVRAVLLGDFKDEESIKRAGRAASLEIAREASRMGYVEEFVSYEVDSGIFISYEDGSERLFPDIKVYHLKKK